MVEENAFDFWLAMQPVDHAENVPLKPGVGRCTLRKPLNQAGRSCLAQAVARTYRVYSAVTD